MTSSEDGRSVEQYAASSLSVTDARKTRSPTRGNSPDTSTAALPIRSYSPASLVASRSSTLSGVLSRSGSPNGRLSLSLARFGRPSTPNSLGNASDANDETRSLIVRSFLPVIAVYSSPEADDLARRKGFKNDFSEVLRPYGERVQGKVVVRDSVGASRSWDDFGVKFLDLGRLSKNTPPVGGDQALPELLEELLDMYLESHEEEYSHNARHEMSPHYRFFLTKLLSSQHISQHETFSHPVATIITISSSTPNPIETLRTLYTQTAQGSHALPPYANPEYLRYYVLVHDDDRDDFAKSSTLFDQMKRHFGLHCHLLRLRSAPCSATSEDSEPVPACEWLSAEDELNRLRGSAQGDLNNRLVDFETTNNNYSNGESEVYLFNTDIAAIRLFIRELVAQSVVPFMEQRISLWNDQIASRRRGIAGRFTSLSKRWGGIGGFGGSSRSNFSTNPSSSGASGNYDSHSNVYRWETPEATLRKMADFAVMLRDYKLAASTYELLRSDYNNDKAWKYLAGANELCCVSHLLNPLAASGGSSSSSGSGSKSLPKLETLDQMLETSIYSYLSRAHEPALALRCVVLGLELLKVRGRAAAEIAAKWATRALDLNVVGSIGHVLISERVISCLASQHSITTNLNWGTRKRKAALWCIATADEWMKLGQADFAATRLDEAHELYMDLKDEAKTNSATEGYKEMSEFMHQLRLAVRMKLDEAAAATAAEEDDLFQQRQQQQERDSKQRLGSTASSTGANVDSATTTGMTSPSHPPTSGVVQGHRGTRRRGASGASATGHLIEPARLAAGISISPSSPATTPRKTSLTTTFQIGEDGIEETTEQLDPLGLPLSPSFSAGAVTGDPNVTSKAARSQFSHRRNVKSLASISNPRTPAGASTSPSGGVSTNTRTGGMEGGEEGEGGIPPRGILPVGIAPLSPTKEQAVLATTNADDFFGPSDTVGSGRGRGRIGKGDDDFE